MRKINLSQFANGFKRVAQSGGNSGTRGARAKWAAIFLVGALLLVSVIASLSGAGKQSSTGITAGSVPNAFDMQPSTGYPASAATATPAAAAGFLSAQSAPEKAPAGSRDAAAGAQAPQAESGTSPSASGTTNQTTTTSTAWDRMLVRTANIQLSVKDVSAGVNSVMSIVASHGGRVLQLNSQQSGEYTISSVTLQVPSAEFDKIVPELHSLGGQVKKVISENISSEDVTDEYTDLSSQLRNLKATEDRILALQQKADNLQDVLSLDRELRDIQGQIEQITGRTNYLSKRAEMSQITLSLQPEAIAAAPVPTPQPALAWDPANIATQAWNSSLDLLSKVGTVVIAVVVFLWWLLPIALVVWLFARRSNRRGINQTPPVGTGEQSV